MLDLQQYAHISLHAAVLIEFREVLPGIDPCPGRPAYRPCYRVTVLLGGHGEGIAVQRTFPWRSPRWTYRRSPLVHLDKVAVFRPAGFTSNTTGIIAVGHPVDLLDVTGMEHTRTHGVIRDAAEDRRHSPGPTPSMSCFPAFSMSMLPLKGSSHSAALRDRPQQLFIVKVAWNGPICLMLPPCCIEMAIGGEW